MPAVMERFLQLNLSLLTGAMSGAAPLAEGQAQGSPAPLSPPPSAGTALLWRLALSINKVAPVGLKTCPSSREEAQHLWQVLPGQILPLPCSAVV